MQAIILAGGKGTRLKPYTITIPKPLVPLNDKPILEILINQLKNQGFHKINLAVGHLAQLIEAYFGNGEKFNLTIEYSFEKKPLGTAGPLTLVSELEENFLVMNSDDLTDIDYKKLYDYHIENNGIITIATYSKKHSVDLGVLEFDQSNRLKNYIEKPQYVFNVSMGIYVFNKRAIDFIPKNEYYDFPELINRLLNKSEKVICYEHKGFWLDIGRPEDYEIAIEEFETLKFK